MRITAPLLALLAVVLGAAPADAQRRRGAAEPHLPPTPTLPRAPQILIPGSLDNLGDWSRPLVFRGSRVAMPAEVRLFLCPRGGFPQRGGRCRPPPGGSIGAPGGADESVAGWHAGLRPASHTQRSCPPGTTPTQARDNPSVTRCLPA